MTERRLEADYLIETAHDPHQAADAMAGEQSSGTFIALPGESPQLKERSAAKVERLDVIGDVEKPSLPGSGDPKSSGNRLQAKVTLSWPSSNVNASLPNLLATVAGNLYELKQFSGLRLMDVRLTDDFKTRYAGPKFGISGTLKQAGMSEGPLIGTIIKPSIGLTPDDTAALTKDLCEAGIDFIKDDELQGDARHCPFDERVRAVMRVVRNHRDRTGKTVMYAFNLTGDLDEMKRRHDLVKHEGGTCIMASLNSVGLVGIIELARQTELPIHGHRNGWGYLSRHPALGWDYVAWQKIWRLAGVDHMHVNGIGNKFSESDESVVRSAHAVLMPLFADLPALAMPVFSSGQTIRQAHPTYAALKRADLIFAAGGGIMAHPGGPGAGMRALRDAWDAAMSGVTLDVAAHSSKVLREAMETFP